MIIKDISLLNFRNYEKAELQFLPGISLIKGSNGQGKSNLLEAIYCLCFAGSFRPARDEDMVRWDSNYYFIQGNIYSNNYFYRMEVGYAPGQRRKVVKINGQLEKKKQYMRSFPVVFFVPEDLEIIRRGPEERRRYLDRELCQLDAGYAADLTSYRRALLQKNRLLKENKFSGVLKKLLEPWDKQLVQYGSRIMVRRAQIIDIWNKMASDNYRVLFKDGPKLQLDYLSFTKGDNYSCKDLKDVADNMSREIKLRAEEERRRGYALVGPHKDDLIFLLDKREAKKFASHGQQRSAVIALKAAQVQYYAHTIEKPLFMLDDIFSELDEKRRRQCLHLFRDAAQVFMTVTSERNYLENGAGQKIASLFCVQEGKIKEVGHDEKNGFDHP